jgi:hypothetical protein
MREAKREMRVAVEQLTDDETIDYGVENCHRRSRSKVRCWYYIDYVDDLYCMGKIQARKYDDGFVAITFPGSEPFCDYYDE